MDLALTDGSQVRLELSDVGEPLAVPMDVAEHPGAHDLPEGFGAAIPVSRRDGSRSATAAVTALRTALRPLGPLLDEVHDALSASANPPHEIRVEFGLQIGQDLRLGIVGASGRATMTVAATWQNSPIAPTDPPTAGGDRQD